MVQGAIFLMLCGINSTSNQIQMHSVGLLN